MSRPFKRFSELYIFFGLWMVRCLITLYYAHPYLSDDTRWHYIPMAQNILAGNGYSTDSTPPFHPTALRMPGYAFFLIFFYCPWSDHPWVTLVVQQIIEFLGIIVLFRTTLFLTENLWVSRLVALLWFIWPYNIMVNGQILREPIFTPIFTIAFCLFLCAVKKDSIKWLIFSSVFFIFSLYLREDTIYYILFFSVFWLYLKRRNIRMAVHGFSLLLLLGILSITPWSARNYLVFNKIILLANHTQHLLWAQHNIAYKEVDPPEEWRLPIIDEKDRAVLLNAEDVLSEGLLRHSTPDQFDPANKEISKLIRKYLSQNPLRYISFLPKRAFRYVTSSRIDFLPGYPTSLFVKYGSAIFHTSLYFFGIMGLLLSRKHAYLILIIFFVVGSVAIIGVLTGRYEFHIFPILFLGCGLMLQWLQAHKTSLSKSSKL